ncbi:uncharacterized protein BDW43DRAFT_275225 [Aspergillus alliaceus]|uniref:uncharacterized protein n=1 Tax=Petromyces alliaceus TaxID=209559 RepID=UPI0012A40970|nr:uncharacterized protein BDW43DRAFT_275225 [Aspergillus alliaceus]KAB8233818.1 hypothetical protein BDW43DRAFT_275225 [Aspergillus alliaceus]
MDFRRICVCISLCTHGRDSLYGCNRHKSRRLCVPTIILNRRGSRYLAYSITTFFFFKVLTLHLYPSLVYPVRMNRVILPSTIRVPRLGRRQLHWISP